MIVTLPASEIAKKQHGGKKYSSSLRVWHWMNTVIISGSLLTVLLNSTITDERPVAEMIQNDLNNQGVTINGKQAHLLAHGLGDKVWNVHIYFGYVLGALLLFRLVLEFFQLTDQKFIGKLKDVYQQLKYNKINRKQIKHEFAVKSIYAIFYVLLFILVVTGLFLSFEDFFASFRAIRHSVKEVHGFCMYLILGFIFVHIAGVIIAERKNDKGMVSDMINGGES
jgi:Ni/Fe-hydrogenase 1 B-type cytochrome subunit